MQSGGTGMSVATIIKLCTVLDHHDGLLGQESSGERYTLSNFSRIQKLSQQELVEEAVNLMIKSFHISG